MEHAYTNQTAFDAVYKHLLTQNERSAIWVRSFAGVEASHCQYRGPNGLKCAVGALIPDELYKPEFDNRSLGTSVSVIIYREPAIHDLFRDVSPALLEALQSVHDGSPVESWPNQLATVAQVYNLTIPEQVVQ